MADELPTPIEELEQETQEAEEELNQMDVPQEDDTEELAEESLPSEETEEETPEVDEQKEDQEPVSEEQESESAEEPPEGVSERAKKRYKDLNDRLRQATSERDQLLQLLQQQGYTQQQAQQMAPQIQADPYQQDYQAQVTNEARRIAQGEIQRERIINQHAKKVETFQEDLKQVEGKYDVLNEDSPDYDEKLSNFVADVYESKSAKDPNIRLTDVVDTVMTLREQGAKEAVDKQTDQIRKKVASQAISPSGGKTESQTLIDQLKGVDSEKELLDLRKQIPLGD